MLVAKRKPTALIACLMIAALLGLAACAGNAAGSAGASGSASASSAESGSSKTFGSPWATTIVIGNLPDEAPSVKDDLYTHYEYDFLQAHQDGPYAYMSSTENELKDATVALINDESRTSHEIEQMRILYNQAADQETLAKIGFSEVQPYIDMIDAVSSIEEMNALLASDEFPFTPFVTALLCTHDTRSELVVGVFPNFILCEALMEGGQYYQDSDDPTEQRANDLYLTLMSMMQLTDLSLIGVGEDEQTAVMGQIIDFEKKYGKHSDYTGKYLSAEYGALTKAAAEDEYTLDELCAMCPNLPMKAMLDKCGKGSASAYIADSPEWMTVLSDMWTDQNLETIKLVAKCKILVETRPYRDQSVSNVFLESMGMPVDAQTMAYNACDSLDTFSQVIAKEYVNTTLGDTAKDRLTGLTAELVVAYEGIIADTAWLDPESDELVIEKLNHMKLNVLEPSSGWFDYSGVELTPTDQGGTLFTNYLKLKQYRYDREAERIGKPSTADDVWFAIKPTLTNAFYDPTTNSINILPGITTSAVYSNDMSDTELLAKMGAIIGHEISHGFDYLGSQLDAYGSPVQLFTEDDEEVFLAKCMELADRFSAIECLRGRYVDGQNVVAEAAADLCGLQACMVVLGEEADADYDLFFRSYAQIWGQTSDKLDMELLMTDEHPFSNLRVNVSVQMLDELYDELGVAEGDGMYLPPDERVSIWGENA